MKISKLIITAIAFGIFTTACSEDNIDTIQGDYQGGLLISGEGSGAGTGSVSHVAADLSSGTNFIYQTVNDKELGTFLQSMAFSEENAYITVDNTHSITVVDRYTFQEITVINEDLEHPRYMAIKDGTGYATNWGSTADSNDDYIAVLDLTTNTVIKTIPVVMGPERIVAHENKLYVSHKGAFGTNNIISVINIDNDSVVEIVVEDRPDELFIDENNILYVLSEGQTIYDSEWNVTGHTMASISKINTTTQAILNTWSFAEGQHPSLFAMNGNQLYYFLGTGVYSFDKEATELPESFSIETGSIYGMAIQNNHLFTLKSSFSALSDLYGYNLSSGAEIGTIKVALGASKIYFN
jgi:YVTN family beta-propeller protein